MGIEQSSRKSQLTYFLIAIILALILIHLPISGILENYIFDAKIFLYKTLKSSSNQPENKIVLIEIDDKSVKEYGFPFSYKHYMKFIKKAQKSGARSIVFLFPLSGRKTTSGDEKSLAKFLKTGIPVFTSYYFTRLMDGSDNLSIAASPSKLLNRLKGRGFVLALPDHDGVIRKRRLGIRRENKTLPSIELVVSGYLRDVQQNAIRFEKEAVRIGSNRVPTDRDYNLLFVPEKEERFGKHSFHEVIHSKKIPDLKGKTLLVGLTLNRHKKRFMVPGLLRSRKSSLYTSASTISSLLNNRIIMDIPGWLNVVILLVMAAIVGLILPVLRNGTVSFSSMVLIILCIIIAGAAFMMGINMKIAPIILIIPILGACMIIYRHIKLQSRVKKFVPNQLINVLQEGNPDNDLQTVVKNATVLFSDIKGYTTLSERYNPAVVMDMLNEYIKIMNRIVDKNGGFMINYQGDGLLAVFGLEDGEDFEKHAYNAAKSAIIMQDAVRELRRKSQMEYRELFVVGIGIATGEVAIGTLGTDTFRQYTVIGDTVNVAARLQSIGKKKRVPILINEETYLLVKQRMRVYPVQTPQLKGKLIEEPKIFEVHSHKPKIIPRSPGIRVTDDRETAIMKKINYYRDIRTIMEV